MTTEYQCICADDVGKQNDVYNLDKSKVPVGFTISAKAWIKPGSYVEDEEFELLSYIFSRLNTKKDESDVWICVSNSAWQPDNRIERYKRLWKRIERTGLELPSNAEYLEELKERSGEVRFFGALKVSDNRIDKILFSVLNWDNGSFVLISNKGSNIGGLVASGWENVDFPEDFILRFICWNDAVLIRKYGEFDAFDRGYLAIGNAKALSRLFGSN